MIYLKPRFEKVIPFIFKIILGLFLLVIICSLVIKRHDDLLDFVSMLFYLMVVLFMSPVLILPISYFYTDLRKKVYMDEENQKLLIKQKGNEIIISQENILKSYYVKVNEDGDSRYKFYAYSYLLFVLKDEKRIYLTNLLCDPDSLIKTLDVKCEIIENNIPFLSKMIGESLLSPNSFEKKVQEFEELFENHSNEKLANIISQKRTYTDYAREAALRILKKRKQKSP